MAGIQYSGGRKYQCRLAITCLFSGASPAAPAGCGKINL
jgi:hypothetical protein